MRLPLYAMLFFIPIFAISCNNPSGNDNGSTAYIENNKYINTDIKFSVVFPSSWLLTMDTTVGSTRYNLFARKPATDSVIFAIIIIKGITEFNIDSIMSRENRALSLSLENYSITVMSNVGIPNTVSGMLGFTYTANGKRFNDGKTFSVKEKNEVIFYSSLIADPFIETAIAIRDIIGSIKFE